MTRESHTGQRIKCHYYALPKKHLADAPSRSLRKFSFSPFFDAFFRGRIKSQEQFIPSASRLITTVPFTTFTGGVVVIKAQFGDHPDSLNFIVDTGSGGISLDSETCVRLKLEPVPSDKTIKGIAGIRQVKFLYNQSFTINGLRTDSLNFHVNDYDILTSVYGDKIDGIIGLSFFNRYIVKIDYDSNRIFFYSKGYFKYPKGGYLLRPNIVSIPILPARLRDDSEITGRFYFDTGAGLCTLLSTDFVSDSVFMKTKKKPLPTQAQGLGGKADMGVTTIKELKVGPYKFKNVPAYIFDDEYNVTSYPYVAGLIGNDVLRRLMYGSTTNTAIFTCYRIRISGSV